MRRTMLLVLVLVTGGLLLSPWVREAGAGDPAVSGETANTMSFDAGGVKVILRQSKAAGTVAANLYLLGGSRQLTQQTAGIEMFLLDASEHGTRSYPRDVLRRNMSRLGSSIVVEPGHDWTMIGIRTSSDRFDSTWAILADRVLHPSLPEGGVELVRQRILSGLAQQRDDPDALAGYLADSIAFAGHPYSIRPSGTERSIAALTVADLRQYHEMHMVTSRMLLVVVGDIERDNLERLVANTLGRLPVGNYRWTPPPPVPRSGGAAVLVHRLLPTNYILGYFPGPLASERDAAALRIATSALTGRMFAEIRTRRNLTYDVHAPYLERSASAGGLYVSTIHPRLTLQLMREAVRELRQEQLDPVGLRRMEGQYITEYFLDNETHAAQANFLARAEIFRGDWRLADRFVDELRAVTPAQVQQVVRRYIRDLRFAYVGDTTLVDRRLLESF